MKKILNMGLIMSAMLFGACSSSSSTSEISCADTCAAAANKCGQAVPNCESGCSSSTQATRSCVVNAASCQAALLCGSSQQTDTGVDTGVVNNDTGTRDTGSQVRCAGTGKACSADFRCSSWRCTCSDGNRGEAPGVCSNSTRTCDTTGLGVGSTCQLYCQNRSANATNASNLGECN